ncbi:MAG: response regulator [Holophagales bacterium]|nr:response regulator [Holophagales bacterium]
MVRATGPATANEKRPAKETILLVDDEPGILAALAFQLESSYEVVTRDRPADALELLEALDVAAIVSDQRMPGMTGSELLAASARLRPDAARILLTGYSDLTAVIDAVNAGPISFYLTKPWRPAELEAVLSRGVERWRFLRERERLFAGWSGPTPSSRRASPNGRRRSSVRMPSSSGSTTSSPGWRAPTR